VLVLVTELAIWRRANGWRLILARLVVLDPAEAIWQFLALIFVVDYAGISEVQLCLGLRVGLFIIPLVPHPTYGYFQYKHLVFRHHILTDEFSSVRRARSILTIPEA